MTNNDTSPIQVPLAIKRKKVAPRKTPLTYKHMRTVDLRGDLISGVVAVDLADIILNDHEWLLDEVSRLLTGTELLSDIEFHVVGHDEDTLWLKITGDARYLVDQQTYSCYLEEVLVLTQEEAKALCTVSEHNPWMEKGGRKALGHGNVLPVHFWDVLGEGVVLPEGIGGVQQTGFFINGWLEDVLEHFDALGTHRLWRLWPESNCAVVVPAPHYSHPAHDPLLMHLVKSIPLKQAFPALEDLQRTLLVHYEGGLLVQSEQGQRECWSRLEDDRGGREPFIRVFPVVEYEGDLYFYEPSDQAPGMDTQKENH